MFTDDSKQRCGNDNILAYFTSVKLLTAQKKKKSMPRKEIKNCNMVKEKTLPKALFTFTLTDDLIRRFLLAVFVRLLNKFKACANLEHFSEVLVYLWKLRPVNPCHFVVLFYVCVHALILNPMIIEPSARKASSCSRVNNCYQVVLSDK